MSSFLFVIYYNMIIAWSIYYTFSAFLYEIPWKYCGTTELTSRDCFQWELDRNCFEKDNNTTFWNKTCSSVEEVCTFSFFPSLEDCYTQDMETMHQNCTGVEIFYNNVNESLSLFINETSGFIGCQNSKGKQFSLNEVNFYRVFGTVQTNRPTIQYYDYVSRCTPGCLPVRTITSAQCWD